MEVFHHFAPLIFALQGPGNHVMHPAIDVPARGTFIPVSSFTQIFRIMVAMRRKLFYVRSHREFAVAFLEALNSRTNIVLGTTLNCTDADSYYSCASRNKCV